MKTEIRVCRVVCGPVQTNTYLLSRPGKKEAVVIDPADGQAVLNALEKEGLTCERILLTHGHFDHIGGVEALRERFGCPAAVGAADAEMLEDSQQNASFLMGRPVTAKAPEILLKNDETFCAAGIWFRTMLTPGHTPGGCSYVLPNACMEGTDHGMVFVGDTLFCGGVGRTDLPGGRWENLRQSVELLYVLQEDTIVFPGHGDLTTIGEEGATNPYVRRRQP